MRATLWGAMIVSMAAMAAEVAPIQPAAPRSVDNLPMLAWSFLIGWAFAGWVIASLKPAVIAMNDAAQPRAVAIAGVISTLVAALAVGVMAGLYLLTIATWNEKPMPALYAYIGALGGGFWGMKGMEFGIDIFKTVVSSWASKRTQGGNPP